MHTFGEPRVGDTVFASYFTVRKFISFWNSDKLIFRDRAVRNYIWKKFVLEIEKQNVFLYPLKCPLKHFEITEFYN